MTETPQAQTTTQQSTLAASNAGMRVIAQTTLYNKGDFARLRQFIEQNYDEAMLAEVGAGVRLAEFKASFRLAGRLKIEQVIGVDKHRALIAVSAERGGMYALQMIVAEPYPHKILAYILQPLIPHETAEE
jgi:NADH pyrophosphatase NudC (nudix superfamily)